MNPTTDQPLVLVADDDQEFREELIPEALARLSVRVLTAKDVYEALSIAMKQDAQSEDLPDLIVLDMHMPLDSDTTEIAADGGIQFLRACRLAGCPVVVFTADPSYQNCVGAVQAGAAAYLPKSSHDTYEGNQEGGIDHLVAICRRLLEEVA